MASEESEYEFRNKICGIIDYSTGIIAGSLMTISALIWVYFNMDEEEMKVYFVMGAFNMTCLGMTYLLQK